MPIALRADFDAAMVRAAAKRSKDGPQARRLLVLAAIYEGATGAEAAKIGGVTLQIVRDWVLKFNARGPDGDHRERPDPGGSRGGALADRRSPPMGFRRISGRGVQADDEPRTARHELSQAVGPPSPSCAGGRRDRGF